MFTQCLFINHCCLFNNNWNNNFKIQNYYGIEPGIEAGSIKLYFQSASV